MADSTQGNGSPKEPDGQAPSYMTAEEFNRATTAREKAFEKRIAAMIADNASASFAKFEELVKAKPEDPKDKPAEKDVALNALQAKYSELASKFEAEQKARSDAEKRAREDSAFSALRQGLTAAKFRPELVETLADSMFSGRNKRVEFDENGNPLFKVKVSPGRGMPEEDQLFSLDEGIKAYAKSKEAESFVLPPSGTGGPVTTPRNIAPPGQRVEPVQSAPTSDEGRLANAAALMAKHGVQL